MKGHSCHSPSSLVGSSVILHLLYWEPSNWWVPKIAKIVKMKARKMPTLSRPGSDESSDWIKAFMLGSELIDLRGRKIRKVLTDFIEELPSTPGIHVTIEIDTTKISSQFQRSLI